MKVVVNRCFGGFGLSDEAENLYALKKGFKLFRYEQVKYKHRDGEDKFIKVKSAKLSATFKKDHGDVFTEWPDDDSYWYSSEVKRDCPELVEVVEELGDRANGDFADLEIVEIPDGIDWSIKDYDGNEHVAERHRTW